MRRNWMPGHRMLDSTCPFTAGSASTDQIREDCRWMSDQRFGGRCLLGSCFFICSNLSWVAKNIEELFTKILFCLDIAYHCGIFMKIDVERVGLVVYIVC